MAEEIRVKIPLGNKFNHRGRNLNEEVHLINGIFRRIDVDEKRFGLQIVKKEVVLPNGKTLGITYETRYKGNLLLGDSERLGLEAVTYDCPHEYGHNVSLREDLDIELNFENAKGKIRLRNALIFPNDFAQNCLLEVPDRKSFLETLSNRGYTGETLQWIGAGVNTNKFFDISTTCNVVGEYLTSLFYSCSP